MTDPIQNAANPDKVQKSKDKAKFAKEQQDADLKDLLAMPQFRRYIWRHINETCGLMRDPFSANGSVMNLNVGMQAMGRALFAEIESVDPRLIPQIMIEWLELQK